MKLPKHSVMAAVSSLSHSLHAQQLISHKHVLFLRQFSSLLDGRNYSTTCRTDPKKPFVPNGISTISTESNYFSKRCFETGVYSRAYYNDRTADHGKCKEIVKEHSFKVPSFGGTVSVHSPFDVQVSYDMVSKVQLI